MVDRSACRGCWGRCRFMRCLVPGSCSACLRPSTPLGHAHVPAAPALAANESALHQLMPELALAQPDAITPLIKDEVSTPLDHAVSAALTPAPNEPALHQTAEIALAQPNVIAPLIKDEQVSTTTDRAIPIKDELVSTTTDRGIPAPAPANEPALHLERQEITLTQLDAIIPLIIDEIDRLDPAKSSSSASQAPISQRLGNMLAQWEAKKETCTSFIDCLPKELTNEVAGNGKTLLMPLLAKALGSMGAVHWLGIGFAFIAWSLDNVSSIDQNREDCIGILRRSLHLLQLTKKIWETTSSDTATIECLQDSVERAFRCAVFCASGLKEVWILRFVKANTVKDAINTLRRELDEAYLQNTALTGMLIMQSEAAKLERQVTFASSRDDIVGGQAEGVIDAAIAFLRGSSDVVKVALLHGMGGIGKSTLALQIFAELQKSTTYRACRVELPLDTRDEHLRDIQREILAKVCKREFKLSNSTDGKRHMEKEFSQIKDPIFLYVDNVMEQQHLCKSLPKATFFPKASRILITSRNKYGSLDLGVMRRDFSYETFEVQKLQREPARQLLWKQLESEEEDRDRMQGGGVNDIASEEEKEVLSLCDGLPLALVVVGKYILHENGLENVGVWHEVVKSMKRAEPLDGIEHDELYSRIQFSVQKLDKNVKAAFLDAVFFLEINMYAKDRSWERVDRLVSPRNMHILHQRALIVQGGTGLPEIHDVLKTLGRRMMAEDVQELRIVGMDQLREQERNDNGCLQRVVALHSPGEQVDVNWLRQMRSLRLLSHVHVTGECEEAIRLTKLRVTVGLEGSMSSVNIDWSKCLSLKEVCWRGDGVSIFNLEVFKHDSLSMELEALQLESWKELQDVKVLETLRSLKELQLADCPEIETLPVGIARLTGLKELALRQCSKLKELAFHQPNTLRGLPQGISAFVGLQRLHLFECQSLRSLPDELASLTGLTRLHLERCARLQSLPDGLTSLTGLRALDLEKCGRLQSLPDGLASLTSLTLLRLEGCASLQSLPNRLASLTGLTILVLNQCASLQSLPDELTSLTSLQWLGLAGCASLQSLPEGLASLMGLTWLCLSGCSSLQSLPDRLASLTGLTGLHLNRCARLRSLPNGLTSLTCLRELSLNECVRLQSLPDGLTNLTHLIELNLGGCVRLQSLPNGFMNLTNLRMLNLRGCESLQSLPNELASLTSLTGLSLGRCASLQSLPNGLASLTSLRALCFGGCKGPQSLSDGLVSLTSLTQLDLGGCASFQSLPDGLGSLTSLIYLCLGGCASLQSLPDGLGSLTGLTELDLRGCASLQSLPDGLGSLIGLTELDLCRCASLQSLPDGLGSLTGLTKLELHGCASLQSLPAGLASLTGLTGLDLGGCVSLQSLPNGLGSLTGLTWLDLDGCACLQSLPDGLASLTSLTWLGVDGCVSLQSLPNSLTNLTSV